jgi:Thiol:disulfide interchange protein DsbD, N-terminal
MKLGYSLLLVLCLAATSFAQISSAKKPPKVTFAPMGTVKVTQGGKAEFQAMFRVVPGFHINSNKPSSELLIPTAINFDVPTNISITGVAYPAGENYTFAFSPDEKLSVYTGDFTVTGKIMTTSVTPKGTYRVHATLRYQACDNRACYPPASIPLHFDVNVQKPSVTKAKRRSPAQSPHIHK